MSRRINVNLVGVCAISVLSLLLIFASQRLSGPNYATELYHHPGVKDIGQDYARSSLNRGGVQRPLRPAASSFSSENESIRPIFRIGDIIREQRNLIRDEMQLFRFPNQSTLADFTPETGGTPLRSLIITTWRSGSTFLGDILNAMPGNYYHYEPLLDFDIIQVRDEPLATKAISNLKHLLNCDYAALTDYLEYGLEHKYLFTHNTRLWRQCLAHPFYCWKPKFLSPFCRLFPLQSMKVVRLRLGIAARLLYDTSLNVQIVLLIRDPRGTMQSRKHRDWCPGRPDCDHAPTVCRDMVADHLAASILLKQYPTRLKVVRYEDLSLDAYEMTRDILSFYKLPFDEEVQEFLDSHTKLDYGGVSSTFRDSKSVPFHWTKDLKFEEIEDIQNSCAKAMKLWGYKMVANETELNSKFNPLLPYSFD